MCISYPTKDGYKTAKELKKEYNKSIASQFKISFDAYIKLRRDFKQNFKHKNKLII